MAQKTFDFNGTVADVEKLLSSIEDPMTDTLKAESMASIAREKIAACREYLRKEREMIK